MIDAVIAWVDGDDPSHAEKINEYRSLPTENTFRGATAPTRFRQIHEVSRCVESIHRFASWIENIYIVTDNQAPDLTMCSTTAQKKVKLVDHRDIYRDHEQLLPVFNSRSIGTMLWRIPNLSEKFIYFNDDFILINNVCVEDFFPDNQVVIRGVWRNTKLPTWRRLALPIKRYIEEKIFDITKTYNLDAQRRAAQLCGFNDMYYRLGHAPHAARVSTFQQAYSDYNESMIRNASYKFRSLEQFTAFTLSAHLEIRAHTAKLQNLTEICEVHGELDSRQSAEAKLNNALEQGKKFLCLQSADRMNESDLLHIMSIIDAHVFAGKV